MSLGIANTFAAAASPASGGATSTQSADNATDGRLAMGSAAEFTGGAERVQTLQAVTATPATAKATVVDLNRGQSSETEMPKYPISGPDEFARTMADRIPEPVAAAQSEAEAPEDVPAQAASEPTEEVEASEAGAETQTESAGGLVLQTASEVAAPDLTE